MGARTSEEQNLIIGGLLLFVILAFATVILSICIGICETYRQVCRIHPCPMSAQLELRQWMRRVSCNSVTNRPRITLPGYVDSKAFARRGSFTTATSATETISNTSMEI
jgi:hypothetical protein